MFQSHFHSPFTLIFIPSPCQILPTSGSRVWNLLPQLHHVLADPSINCRMVYLKDMALPQVVRDFPQRDSFEVQIECHNPNWIVPHLLKTYVWHSFPRTNFAFVDLLLVSFPVSDDMVIRNLQVISSNSGCATAIFFSCTSCNSAKGLRHKYACKKCA